MGQRRHRKGLIKVFVLLKNSAYECSIQEKSPFVQIALTTNLGIFKLFAVVLVGYMRVFGFQK
jgi:hypothetical protein